MTARVHWHEAQVIKGPVTKHLPLDCTRIGFSWSAEKKVSVCSR